jgi:hypothetical protein
MALRMAEEVVRGFVDNTRKGVITGELWLLGRDEPIRLELTGNGHPDLAGCRCTFTNPAPTPADRHLHIDPVQRGKAGDMTVSRKVRIPALPLDQWLKNRRMGLPAPEKRGNAVYLEWYSEANGRVVVETTAFEVQLDLPEWRLSEAEAKAQAEQGRQSMEEFLGKLEKAVGATDFKTPEGREMDEHEWEIFLRNSDARTERYGELLDKFEGHPDADRLVDEGMGWNRQAPSRHFVDADDDDDDAPWRQAEEMDEPTPDPSREGIDWVRNEHGRICHPLQHRATKLCHRIIDETRGYRDDPDDSPEHQAVADLRFQTQCLSAKLAGALGGMARDSYGDAGFVIACLKRIQPILNAAVEALQRVEANGALAEHTEFIGSELFALRTDIIALMNRLRRK